MTKERAEFSWKLVAGQKAFFIAFSGPQAHDSSVQNDRIVGHYTAQDSKELF
jgi:hypothetical protein